MNRAIAFIDVLGFKHMIKSQTAKELGERYKSAIDRALEDSPVNAVFSKEPSLFPCMGKDDKYCISNVFSDSIILSSLDDSEDSCLKLLVFTFMLTRVMLVRGFLVRGGISYGDMFIDTESSIFVGNALINAYELETKQEWAGITIDNSVVTMFPNIFNESMKYGNYLKCLFVKYLVPMKQGGVKEEYTINWRWNLIVENGTQSLLGAPLEWSAKTKIENTLKYAEFIRNFSFAYPPDSSACPIEIRTMFVTEVDPRIVMTQHGDAY